MSPNGKVRNLTFEDEVVLLAERGRGRHGGGDARHQPDSMAGRGGRVAGVLGGPRGILGM